jgi:imidazolonepropionase-like amidohydrolase
MVDPDDMPAELIGYRVGWLIDGSGNPAVQDRLIQVNDGYIQRIVDASQPPPPQMEIVDFSDRTVIPALVDSHVHLVISGDTDMTVRQNQLQNTYDERRQIISRHLRQHLAWGVMAVRDGGDHHGDTLRYKWDGDNDDTKIVTIASAGRAHHASGRYGKLIGVPVESGLRLAQSAFRIDPRRDHLKIVNSGLNSLTQFGVETPAQFEQDELAETVALARQHGQPTMVHANGKRPVKLAVEAGCDSIEHGFFMGRENLLRMADKGVVWVPTAVTMKAYEDYLKSQGHRSDPSFADVSRRNLEHQLEQMRIARELGVSVALGTDAGSPGVHHGKAVKEELGLLIQAGFSIEAAIGCASHTGATLMKLDDRGMLAPGMRADFIVLKGPVSALPEALDAISCRIVGGKMIDIIIS